MDHEQRVPPEIITTPDPFVRAYLAAAFWTTTEETDDMDHSNYGCSMQDLGVDVHHLAPECLYQAMADCAKFIRIAGAKLADWPAEQAGHDFWLTRNGHGAGFWDRGLPFGLDLSDLVGHGTAFPPIDFYTGDDGRVYC